jgi:hypothetical protein
MSIPFSKGQQNIALLWFCGGGFAMIVLIVQSIAGTWGSWVSDAWSWLLPTILPTLTLILSTVTMEAIQQRASRREVNVCLPPLFGTFGVLFNLRRKFAISRQFFTNKAIRIDEDVKSMACSSPRTTEWYNRCVLRESN